MIQRFLLAGALSAATAAAVCAAPPAVSVPAPPAVGASLAPSDYDDLLDAYDEAIDDWKAAIKKADRDERRALRKQHPARNFLPRFQTLAAQGEGRAWMWQIRQARHIAPKLREVAPLKRELYDKLFARDQAQPWFAEVLHEFAKERRVFEEAERIRRLHAVVETSKVAEVKAPAMFLLAGLCLKSDAPKQVQLGSDLYDRLIKEFPDSKYAERAEVARFAGLYLKIGATPPDFVTQDVDGKEFRLSDFRGKVVVLDFWGFW